jgi:hypothetical protein
MLRKIALVLLASAFALGAAGCGEKPADDAAKPATPPAGK